MPRGKYAKRRAARLRRERSPVVVTGTSESTGELNDDGTFTVTNTGPYTRPELERQNVAPLRDIARELGLKPGRARKADLIDAILAKDWAVRNDG